MKVTQDLIARRWIALQVLMLLGLLFGSLTLSQRPEAALSLLIGMGTFPAGWARRWLRRACSKSPSAAWQGETAAFKP